MTKSKQDNQEAVEFTFEYTADEARDQGGFIDEAANADLADEDE